MINDVLCILVLSSDKNACTKMLTLNLGSLLQCLNHLLRRLPRARWLRQTASRRPRRAKHFCVAGVGVVRKVSRLALGSCEVICRVEAVAGDGSIHFRSRIIWYQGVALLVDLTLRAILSDVQDIDCLGDKGSQCYSDGRSLGAAVEAGVPQCGGVQNRLRGVRQQSWRSPMRPAAPSDNLRKDPSPFAKGELQR